MFSSAIANNIEKKWGWLVALGCLLVVMGILAVSFVGLTTYLSVVYLGAMFMVTGLAEIIFGIRTRADGDVWYHAVFGLLFTIAGYMIFTNPLPNMVFLTMLIAAVFMVSGVSTLIAAVVERFSNWGWFALNGAVAVAAAVLIFRNPLASSIWLIGMLVGLEFMFRGIAWISLGVRGRALVHWHHHHPMPSPAG
jgi:uncharacterized membrane protein HdeD (DUF308 family)